MSRQENLTKPFVSSSMSTATVEEVEPTWEDIDLDDILPLKVVPPEPEPRVLEQAQPRVPEIPEPANEQESEPQEVSNGLHPDLEMPHNELNSVGGFDFPQPKNAALIEEVRIRLDLVREWLDGKPGGQQFNLMQMPIQRAARILEGVNA